MSTLNESDQETNEWLPLNASTSRALGGFA